MPDHPTAPLCATCARPATTCRRYRTWRAWTVTIAYCEVHGPAGAPAPGRFAFSG